MNVTIDTYNKSAKQLAEYFSGIGPRTKDINIAFRLAQKNANARVVEIGCGDGRDAAEIIKQASFYQGFDPSVEMLKIAKKRLPGVTFVQADALTFKYPKRLDVVFSFASLLHSPKEDVKQVFKVVHSSLNPNGIFYISLKEKDKYSFKVQNDEFGERVFYYYTPQLIEELAGKNFEKVSEKHEVIGKTRWFEIGFRKR